MSGLCQNNLTFLCTKLLSNLRKPQNLLLIFKVVIFQRDNDKACINNDSSVCKIGNDSKGKKWPFVLRIANRDYSRLL